MGTVHDPKIRSRYWIIGTVLVLILGSAGTYLIVSQVQNQGLPQDATVEVATAKAEAHLENTVATLQERIRQAQASLNKRREMRSVD